MQSHERAGLRTVVGIAVAIALLSALPGMATLFEWPSSSGIPFTYDAEVRTPIPSGDTRAYDLADLMPPGGPRGNWLAPRAARAMPTSHRALLSRLTRHVPGPTGTDREPARVIGSLLIVTAPSDAHQRITSDLDWICWRRKAGAFLIEALALLLAFPATGVVLFLLGLRLMRVINIPDGTCDVCGYHLRATPARCPECGTVPSVPPPVSNSTA